MDPLQRREPYEKCRNCVFPNSNHSAPLNLSQDSELQESAAAVKSCLLTLLNQNETNGLAHELIGSSLTSLGPLFASDRSRPISADPNGTLVELNSLDGLLPDKIADYGALTRLDLVKLSAQLPAQENNDYRLEALGNEWQHFLRLLYSITAIFSILLNVITLIVLYRAKPSELRKYLINLAIGDLFMSCFSIPFTYTEYMLGYWDFANFLCPLVKFVVTLSVYVSVCTMVVIGVNRHVAILYPLKKCSERAWKCRKSSVICAIWLSGIIISAPEYLMWKATPFCFNKKYLRGCHNTWNETFAYYYSVFIYLVTFVIPFMLMCYLYSSIGIQLKHREMPGNADASRDLTMQTKRAKVVKMLIVVVVVFAIFWLPLQTFSLIMFIWPSVRQANYASTSYNMFVGTYFIFHWMSMAHSCLNPLIYCFMNPKFRKDLRHLICGLRWLACVGDQRQPSRLGMAGSSTNGFGGGSGGGGGSRLYRLFQRQWRPDAQVSRYSAQAEPAGPNRTHHYSLHQKKQQERPPDRGGSGGGGATRASCVVRLMRLSSSSADRGGEPDRVGASSGNSVAAFSRGTGERRRSISSSQDELATSTTTLLAEAAIKSNSRNSTKPGSIDTGGHHHLSLLPAPNGNPRQADTGRHELALAAKADERSATPSPKPTGSRRGEKSPGQDKPASRSIEIATLPELDESESESESEAEAEERRVGLRATPTEASQRAPEIGARHARRVVGAGPEPRLARPTTTTTSATATTTALTSEETTALERARESSNCAAATKLVLVCDGNSQQVSQLMRSASSAALSNSPASSSVSSTGAAEITYV